MISIIENQLLHFRLLSKANKKVIFNLEYHLALLLFTTTFTTLGITWDTEQA